MKLMELEFVSVEYSTMDGGGISDEIDEALRVTLRKFGYREGTADFKVGRYGSPGRRKLLFTRAGPGLTQEKREGNQKGGGA